MPPSPLCRTTFGLVIRAFLAGAALAWPSGAGRASPPADCAVFLSVASPPVTVTIDERPPLTLTEGVPFKTVELAEGSHTLRVSQGDRSYIDHFHLSKEESPRIIRIPPPAEWPAQAPPDTARAEPGTPSPSPHVAGGLVMVLAILLVVVVATVGYRVRARSNRPPSTTHPESNEAAEPAGLTSRVRVTKPEEESHRHEQESTMDQSDAMYVGFCRLEGIAGAPTDRVAAAARTLEEVVKTVCAKDKSAAIHSSVYGRLFLVPRRVTAALDFAKAVHVGCAKAGIRVAIGVTRGRVESVQDLTRDNVAGCIVNLAARLANLSGGVGRIAVDRIVAADAVAATSLYPTKSFGPLQKGKVKHTELAYHWLDYLAPQPLVPVTLTGSCTPEIAHVVVYDIVRFSTLELRDLVQVVDDLNHAVRRSLEAAGGNRLAEGKERWYAPAGDGGVLVFRAGAGGGARAAWAFAKVLLDHTAGRISLRVGIATGPIVVLDTDLPVGAGILEADSVSGLADMGGLCASRHFWHDMLENVDKVGWSATPVPSTEAALAVRRNG